ncbi:hypothetical protein [Streptomyces similanensis]|uniref:Uncharacterized protein n=1 Tax=Streptomyces similanensis TaxID=1274988 RepID=A0ABP9LKQ9_9ACTN
MAPKPWTKALSTLHPLFTVTAIAGTANYRLRKAVDGTTVVGLGFALTDLPQGQRAGRAPRPARQTTAPRAGARGRTARTRPAPPISPGCDA